MKRFFSASAAPPPVQPEGPKKRSWDGFQDFLGQRGCSEQQIYWYLVWGRRFEAFCDSLPAEGIGRDHVLNYLQHLRAQANVQAWQVKQAQDALVALCAFRHAPREPQRTAALPDVPAGKTETAAEKGQERGAAPSLAPLLEQMIAALRVRHYALRTEQAYVDWVKRYVRFHGGASPQAVGARGIEAYLEHLAVNQNVAASTQNQALSALLFLYREVLGIEIDKLGQITRARRPKRLPVVLSRSEIRRILGAMHGTHRLMAELLYGTGMRLMECVRLRVKDVDFEQSQITVREGKGAKDRVTLLPETVKAALRAHLETVKGLHKEDTAAGYGRVYLPEALSRARSAATQ
jgi:site-specific recombinase XerC